MTAPNTPASTPELCPDCGRPLGELPPFYKLGACVGRKGSSYLPDCREHTITRLRSDLATLQAKLDALVAERAHLDEAAKLLAIEEQPGKDAVMSLAEYYRRVSLWREAHRMKAGR